MDGINHFAEKVFGRRALFARFFMSGSTAFGVNIVALYVFKEFLGFYYLVASVLAFLFGFVVSFLFMKYWAFQDHSSDQRVRQLALYFAVALFNLVMNSFWVFFFVEFVGIYYLLAQAMASLLIAVSSFFVYKYLIFKSDLAV